MTARLVALDEGPDIMLDRAMVVVGRHPACDARLDSLRVSRHHCCMMQENGEVVVRDLGSTNGIRINGQRVEMGRLKPGDELSIAHIRYRLDNGQAHDQTLADPWGSHPPRIPVRSAPGAPTSDRPSIASHSAVDHPVTRSRPRQRKMRWRPRCGRSSLGGRGEVPNPGDRPDGRRQRIQRRIAVPASGYSQSAGECFRNDLPAYSRSRRAEPYHPPCSGPSC